MIMPGKASSPKCMAIIRGLLEMIRLEITRNDRSAFCPSQSEQWAGEWAEVGDSGMGRVRGSSMGRGRGQQNGQEEGQQNRPGE